MTTLVQAEEAISQSTPRASSGRLSSTLALFAGRAAFFVAFLVVWELAVRRGFLDVAFVSTPRDVADALWTLLGSSDMWANLRTTLYEVGIAFVASVVLGVAAAVILDRAKLLYQLLSPFLTAFNSMPRIALGPLFILWFGIGETSKIVLAFSLGFFIILLSTLGALRNVDRDMLLMSRLYGASEVSMFWGVRLPWALPGVFAGLKLTLIYCMSGAVIGEMIAAQSGLGVLLQTYSGQFYIAGVMAILIILVAVVMALTSIVELVERRLLAWSHGSTDIPN